MEVNMIYRRDFIFEDKICHFEKENEISRWKEIGKDSSKWSITLE